MNVLHIETGRHLAGGPQQVLTLMQGLKKEKIHSTLLCPDNSEIAVRARDLGLSVKPVPYKGEHDLKFVKHIKTLAKQLQPDVVHVHSRRGADTFGSWFARFNKTPCVLTRRVVNHESGFIADLKFKPYQQIVAVSEAVNMVVKHQGVEAARRRVIYDGIDASDFSKLITRPDFLREFELPENAIVFANVGRFTENKNQTDSIEAFALMADANPRAHLVLFGDGAMADELELLVQKRSLEKKVHFAGFKKDMTYWYGGIDILLHTATLEALSVAILEAAFCGIPCIAYQNGGIREVVLHNETGYLAYAKKIDKLSQEMDRLAKNKRLREKMGLAAEERMQELFSANIMTKKYIELYRELA